MKFTYFGHSTFLVEIQGTKLLFDPFITPNELAKDIDIASIAADYILLSHGHQDHVADTETIAKRTGATIIASFEVASWYGQKGLSYHPMNHGGKKIVGDNLTIKCVNAVHSSVLPDGTYGGNPMGFVVWSGTECFYFAGDTALTMDMKLIPMICPKVQVCLFPIGDNFTMGYEDATIASDFVACDLVIGCHYDTFGYVKIDHNKAKSAFEAKGKTLILPQIGQVITSA